MRLDRYISNNTSASRSEVRRLIKAQAVTVNDTLAKNAAMPVAAKDQVLLSGAPVSPMGKLYYMLHKPAGYVCTHHDDGHPTIFDLTPSLHTKELQIAGRLDLDTTGLLLLTNDGQWNHRLTSPKTDCKKVYRTTLTEPFDTQTQQAFATGIQLDGEKKPTLPAQIDVLDAHRVLLAIQEGKYHQVKRMFAATGNHVIELHRLSVGNIQLDPALKPGQFRALTEAEINSLT